LLGRGLRPGNPKLDLETLHLLHEGIVIGEEIAKYAKTRLIRSSEMLEPHLACHKRQRRLPEADRLRSWQIERSW